MKAGIIIPAYNEEKRIGNTLKAYSSFLNSKLKNKSFDYEILVVINNTTDNTKGVVEKAMKKDRRIYYINLKKGGKGYAIAEGFKEMLKGNCELIGFVDADNSTDDQAFYDLIENINGLDGLIASRYMPGAIVEPKQPLKRIIISRLGNFFIRSLFLFPFRDTQCGAKVFKRDAVRAVLPTLTLTQWAFDVELLYQMHKKGFRIKDYPTRWRDASGSKLNLQKASLQAFMAVARLRIVNSPLKRSLEIISPVLGALWRRLKK